MTPELWSQVRALLEQAMDLPPEARAAFFAASPADPAIVAQATRLLTFDQQASAVFSIEAWQGRAARTAGEQDLSGLTIGSYRLLRELGRGGMGAVYLAERADGLYQQQVAVKILQENIHTAALADRFRQERQILARLTHPGIARLLDGGVLPDGRPYLVLEYVDGLPIDRFCVEQKLSLEARLRLFLRVAEAVQSAHQQLILHLDLKPANILVTPAGEPRLLDFGLARILANAETDATNSAEATLRLLTPRYASPEQASGAPLGVASDVFSLATLLYRLLTGALPYPIEDATPLAAIRILNDTAPTPPSQLNPALHGDLDTILLQALRKEPERRYPTVAAFAEDLSRHLASQPVHAHADTFRYRAGKFFRRNRLPVLAAAAAIVVFFTSAIAVLHSAALARRERAAAERRLHDIQELARFYVVDLFASLNDIPGTLPVRKQMADNAVQYLQSMTSERDGDPKFSLDLANGFFEMAKVQGFPNQPSLGDLQGAEKVLLLARQMVELHARQVPTDPNIHAREALLLASQANLSDALGDVPAAIDYEQKAWDEVQPVLRGPKSNRWMQVSTYCMFNASYLALDDNFNMADPDQALLWIDRGEALLLDLGKARPEFLTQPLYRTQLAQVRFIKAVMLGKLQRDSEARTYFEQALHDVDSQDSGNSIEAAEHVRKAHLHYAEFLLARGDLARATAVSAVLEPPAHPAIMAVKGTFDAVEYGIQTRWWAILSAHQGHPQQALDNLAKSLEATRTLYRQAPENQALAGQHAINLVDFAELPGITPQQSRDFYNEAVPLIAAYIRQHPAVLSAPILEARAHLGLARLAAHEHPQQQTDEQKRELSHSLALLTAVAPQRPRLLELGNLLGAANRFAHAGDSQH